MVLLINRNRDNAKRYVVTKPKKSYKRTGIRQSKARYKGAHECQRCGTETFNGGRYCTKCLNTLKIMEEEVNRWGTPSKPLMGLS
jgi:ribosomal protein L32